MQKVFCAIVGNKIDTYPEFISSNEVIAQERLERIIKTRVSNPSDKDSVAWWNYENSSFYWRDSEENPEVQELMAYQKYFHDDVVGLLVEEVVYD